VETLERKITAPVYKIEINDRAGSAALTKRHTSIRKISTKFRQKQQLATSVLRLLVTVNVVSNSPILVTLMMEAICSSETSSLTKTIRRNFPEDDFFSKKISFA
jgi:hypothetical protein